MFNLVLLAEYPMKTASNKNIILDGALLHELRMPLGYWEAKVKDDDEFWHRLPFTGRKQLIGYKM